MSELIKEITHASFIVEDLDRALNYYCDVLGLKIDTSRPELGYSGAWLSVGNQQIHLLCVPDPDRDSVRPEHGGRDRHVAFNTSLLQEVIDRLDRAGCAYTVSKSGRKALFTRDPDQNTLEFIEEN